MQIPNRQLYINGSWQKPAKGQTFDVLSPASGSKIGTIPAATAEDVDNAITSALKVYKSGRWSKKSGAYRAKFLRAIADKVYLRSISNGALQASKAALHCHIKLHRHLHLQ